MDAGTYPNNAVIECITEHFIPLRVRFDQQPLAGDFNVKWTPTLVILDQNGDEHHRTVGFLSAEDLPASLLLGRAKVDFDADNFEPALEALEQLLTDSLASNDVPEAIYLRGVCQYKTSHSPKPLKEAYEKLAAEFPASEWTKRAYPYRLL